LGTNLDGLDEYRRLADSLTQFLRQGERTPGQRSRDRRRNGRLQSFEPKRVAQNVPILFRPTPDLGNVRYLGELPKKNKNEHPVKIVPNSFRITRIGDFVKYVKQLI